MDAVNHFIKFTASEDRDIWLNVTKYVPLAIEGLVCAYSAIKNRKAIAHTYNVLKDKMIHLIDHEALQDPKRRSGEIKRLTIATLKVVAIATVCFAVIGVSCYFFPAPLAIPLAILVLRVAYKTFKGIQAIHNDPTIIQKTLNKMRDGIVHAYVPKEGETRFQSFKRISTNVAITLLVLGIVGVSAYLTHDYLSTGRVFFNMLEKTAGGELTLSKSFEAAIESTPFVYAFYGLAAALALGVAINAFIHKEWGRGVYSLLSMGIAIAAPCVMNMQLCGDMPLYDKRLHHLSYGLILTLLPFRGFNFLGSLLTADSVGYWMCHLRGSQTIDPNGYAFLDYDLSWVDGHLEQVRVLKYGGFNIYDYSNIFAGNTFDIVSCCAGAALFQMFISEANTYLEKVSKELKAKEAAMESTGRIPVAAPTSTEEDITRPLLEGVSTEEVGTDKPELRKKLPSSTTTLTLTSSVSAEGSLSPSRLKMPVPAIPITDEPVEILVS